MDSSAAFEFASSANPSHTAAVQNLYRPCPVVSRTKPRFSNSVRFLSPAAFETPQVSAAISADNTGVAVSAAINIGGVFLDRSEITSPALACQSSNRSSSISPARQDCSTEWYHFRSFVFGSPPSRNRREKMMLVVGYASNGPVCERLAVVASADAPDREFRCSTAN